MNKELQKNPIGKAKDILGIEGEIKNFDVYKKLREYRNNIHPDRFQDEKQKKKAAEKFKEINQLLSEIANCIQQDELSTNPSELAIYKPFYDNVYFQQRIDNSQEEISKLKSEIKSLKKSNQILLEKIESKEDGALLKEMKDIEDIYKITYKKLKPIGGIILLTTLLASMSKIEEVSILIRKYAPVTPNTIDTSLFILFSFLLLLVGKQLIEYKLFSFIVNRYCSAKSATDFMEFLADKYDCEPEKIKCFGEKDAFDYVAGKSSKWKKFLSYLGIRLFHLDTIDNIKKYFLNSLLHKKLIEISDAKNLDRLFKINRPVVYRRYSLEDDDY